MIDSNSPNFKSLPLSRRKAIRLASLAGSSLAVAGSPTLADNTRPAPPPLPGMNFENQGLGVKTYSASPVTPGTNYKLFTGPDFLPFTSELGYANITFSGIYATTALGYFGATLDLPQQARITEVEFYALHFVTGAAYFALYHTMPSTSGTTNYGSINQVSSTNSIVTIPLSA